MAATKSLTARPGSAGYVTDHAVVVAVLATAVEATLHVSVEPLVRVNEKACPALGVVPHVMVTVVAPAAPDAVCVQMCPRMDPASFPEPVVPWEMNCCAVYPLSAGWLVGPSLTIPTTTIRSPVDTAGMFTTVVAVLTASVRALRVPKAAAMACVAPEGYSSQMMPKVAFTIAAAVQRKRKKPESGT